MKKTTIIGMAAIIACVAIGVFIAALMIHAFVLHDEPEAQPKVTEWQYKGHDMIRYEYKGEISVCHSPTCRKCYQVFD